MLENEFKQPFVINFDPEKWDGHFLLKEMYAKQVGEKWLVECKPIDVILGQGLLFPTGHQELNRKIERLLEPGTRKEMSGTKHRSIIMYLPDNPEAFPQGMKDTNIGLFLNMSRALEKEQNLLLNIINEKQLNQSQIMELMASGEANDWMMKRYSENIKGIVDFTVQKTMNQALGQPNIQEKNENNKVISQN